MSLTVPPMRGGRPGPASLPHRAMLIALLACATLAFSMAFACATPFAALAAVAALQMERRDAFVAVSLAWLVNQANGFFFMHYPQTWMTFAWGGAIWIAALAATSAARAVACRVVRRPLAGLAALVAAFVAYEWTLLSTTLVLPSSAAAFSPAVIGRLALINAAATALMLTVVSLRRLAATPHRTSSRSRAALKESSVAWR